MDSPQRSKKRLLLAMTFTLTIFFSAGCDEETVDRIADRAAEVAKDELAMQGGALVPADEPGASATSDPAEETDTPDEEGDVSRPSEEPDAEPDGEETPEPDQTCPLYGRVQENTPFLLSFHLRDERNAETDQVDWRGLAASIDAEWSAHVYWNGQLTEDCGLSFNRTQSMYELDYSVRIGAQTPRSPSTVAIHVSRKASNGQHFGPLVEVTHVPLECVDLSKTRVLDFEWVRKSDDQTMSRIQRFSFATGNGSAWPDLLNVTFHFEGGPLRGSGHAVQHEGEGVYTYSSMSGWTGAPKRPRVATVFYGNSHDLTANGQDLLPARGEAAEPALVAAPGFSDWRAVNVELP